MPENSQRGKYGRLLPGIQTLIDFVIINVLFATLVWIHSGDGINFYGRLRLLWVITNVAFAPSAYFFMRIHAKRDMHMDRKISALIRGYLFYVILSAALVWFLDVRGIPPRFFIQEYVSGIILLTVAWIGEYLVIRAYRRRGGNASNVLIIGTGATGRRVFKNLKASDAYGISIKGFIGESDPGDLPAAYLGNLDDIDHIIKEKEIHSIYLAAYGDNEKIIKDVIHLADDNICRFYYVPSLSHFVKRNFFLAPINGSMPALGLHPTPLLNPVNRALKRGFDILFSSMVLLMSPLILIPVSIAIKLSSPGPIFFKQKRTGYRGHDFYCYKFRTMRVNSDSDSKQATKDDCRKTRVGNFLRHTSIDELPQFWNVFKGDMSVVGPRPHMLSHTEEYRRLISQYMVRHLVKPGITGWAQIQGFRGATDELWQMEKRVDCDVWYIEHWSFMLDMKIIVRTVTNAISGEENAY